MNKLYYTILSLLLLSACQAKTEQVKESQSGAATTSVVDVLHHARASKTSPKRVISKNDSVAVDSTDLDIANLECYVWANTYVATTLVEDDNGEQFELKTEISLKDNELNLYDGSIRIYLSGSEDEAFRGTVTAVAQKNYITVYFDENVDGMEDMFKKGEKLVKFEISYGEYIASWFTPMNDYVDEYSVLSLVYR